MCVCVCVCAAISCFYSYAETCIMADCCVHRQKPISLQLTLYNVCVSQSSCSLHCTLYAAVFTSNYYESVPHSWYFQVTYQGQSDVWQKERLLTLREEEEGGRERVMISDERVLRWGWTEIRLYRYEGWEVVRTLYVREIILQSMPCLILSQCKDLRAGLIWEWGPDDSTCREFSMCWRRFTGSQVLGRL